MLAFESIANQQNEQLRGINKLLAYLKEHSPFYKNHFEINNCAFQTIKNLSDLQLFPTTTKEMMQRHNWDFLCVPNGKVAEFTATSGTLGKPVTVALTENDLQRLAVNEEQSFRIAGVQSSDVVQLLLTLDKQFMAGMAYYSGLRKIGAAIIRTGPGLPNMQYDVAQRLNTSVFVAVPSFIVKLLEQVNIDRWRKLSVRRVICIGEPLRNADFSLNALGQKFQEQWPVQLHSTYASTEMQAAFTECKAGKGGHVPVNLLVVEILDEQGKAVADGLVGEVTITTLGVEGMPLFRYRTGDMAALHSSQCSCGRKSPRLGPIVGRKQQMIKLKGTTLYPTTIMEVLHSAHSISNYVIELYLDECQNDQVRIHLHTEKEKAEIEKQLQDLLLAQLRVKPELIFCSATDVEQLQQQSEQRKLLRILDNRNFSQ